MPREYAGFVCSNFVLRNGTRFFKSGWNTEKMREMSVPTFLEQNGTTIP
ncbi:hypothetical protein ELI_2912 [Eubacterium callanderi]|uniref:Uncharacterized protein n=1 Tax=Eubacterium callanderi TaxID=53442 RepID=E3GP95_9FIRM|nr:hypothetical protein ELI_2912 [Eubacterium callanderi]